MTLQVALIEDFACADAPSDGTLFAAGSMSKAVAALVALLALDLGDDVRRLLSHTSGAHVGFYPGYEQGADVPSLAEARAEVAFDSRAAGSFRYSGGGYVVLQSLLEDAAGKPFARLAQELVLEPLEMHDSTFEQPLPKRLHGRAARDDWRVYPEAAAAGLWTTPADLARFAAAIQSALVGRPSPVPQDVAALMVEPHALIPPSPDFDAVRSLGVEPPEAVGLGLFLADGGRRFGHFGGAYGFTSAFDVSAVDGSGAVVMAALDNGFTEVLPVLAAALAGGVPAA
jgi:CubicO group peptidase (beta-lactamase class C family)